MASKYAEDFTNDSDLSQWFVSQEASIGYNREVFAVAKRDGFTFYMVNENGNKKFQIKLVSSAVKVMNRFMPHIKGAVAAWMSGQLVEAFTLPLGGRVFLEIRPDMRCVSLRKFFRPKPNPTILLPGFQGIGLRFEEFEKLSTIWPEFMNYINEHHVKACEFDDPKEHTNCKICYY